MHAMSPPLQDCTAAEPFVIAIRESPARIGFADSRDPGLVARLEGLCIVGKFCLMPRIPAGNNDIRTRVFAFLQMFTVASMAVFAHNALGEGSVGFALSYAVFQLILTYLWWRTGVHDPDYRPLSQPYALTFLVTALLFMISVVVVVVVVAPAPWRLLLWGISLVLSLLLPLVTFNLGRRDPQVQAEIDRTTDVSPSAVERFGLFTIIVLGEVIVGVVQGVAGHHHLSWLAGGRTAALGMLIAIGLW